MRGDNKQNSNKSTINPIKKIIKFILKTGPVAQPGRALGFYFTPGIIY